MINPRISSHTSRYTWGAFGITCPDGDLGFSASHDVDVMLDGRELLARTLFVDAGREVSMTANSIFILPFLRRND